ncbi:HK97 gp10 family phage protein [Phaeacidiphilus oryzae]|uniref:HK97 gp10 family phage protein n=1 Tax=Phaeacidiphilus oryzae TaxID=348818 RepID=UPI00055C1052|nr:HK97 gp10 family phage protein [Phaeacidiphilus oryzae]
MANKFTLDKGGVGELLRSEGMRAEMLRRAELIKAAAEETAPEGGPRDPHRGLYRSSFVVVSSTRGGFKDDRAAAAVGNTAPYAADVEYGNGHVEAHHTLARAAQAGGG